MTTPLTNLFNAAKSDKAFQDDLKKHEPKDYKPGFFWSEAEKAMYASIYMGYLIAKGTYNDKDYV